LGVQRKRILRLTDDELEFKDYQYEGTEFLRKMKDSPKRLSITRDGLLSRPHFADPQD
jgi:hypothetical protein